MAIPNASESSWAGIDLYLSQVDPAIVTENIVLEVDEGVLKWQCDGKNYRGEESMWRYPSIEDGSLK